MLPTRRVGPFEVSAVGLGCMSLSHAYGTPPPREDGVRLLQRALDLGCTFFDTAALYGFGANEELVGDALSHRRSEFTLASKCGLIRGPDGKRLLDGSPESIKRTCDESLKRLKTDVIDLYYLHRLDRRVGIEESVGALADLVKAGKVRTIGLSEVSGATIRKAHAIHPVTAVQNEYSLWTRNAEAGALDACREVGATFVAFSPVGRGFLAGGIKSTANLPPSDIRLNMPRFQGENFQHNLDLLPGLFNVARAEGCTPAQAVLAWLLSRADNIVPIPGTSQMAHMEENLAAAEVLLDPHSLAKLDELINPATVQGARYNAAVQAEIDTEELAA